MRLGLYQALAGAAGMAAIPVLRARAAMGDEDARERLALAGPVPRALNPLWFHAASVGEVQAVLPLLAEVRRRRPDLDLVLSTMTVTGRALARERAAWGRPFLFPLDIPSVARRALGRVEPRGMAICEIEIWPATIAAARARGVPLALVNGRMSERGLRRYRLVAPLVRECLAAFRLLVVQSEEDRARFEALGAPRGRVRVGGNTKIDADAAPIAPEARSRERARLGLPGEAPLVVAGSVRPEEIAVVLDAFELARRDLPGLHLVLAPRHLDRLPEFESQLRARGLAWRRRSAMTDAAVGAGAAANPPGAGVPASPGVDVLILDTMGELARAYALGEAAFVGGTLHPRYGGHNPLEPAARGTPVLFGPHRRNIRTESAALLAAGAAREVRDAASLAHALGEWLGPSRAHREAGDRALAVTRDLAGAAARTVDFLEEAGFPW